MGSVHRLLSFLPVRAQELVRGVNYSSSCFFILDQFQRETIGDTSIVLALVGHGSRCLFYGCLWDLCYYLCIILTNGCFCLVCGMHFVEQQCGKGIAGVGWLYCIDTCRGVDVWVWN